MIKLSPPVLDVGTVYSQCISKVRNQALKARLSSIQQKVIEASATYLELKNNSRLFEFEQLADIETQVVVEGVVTDCVVTTSEMETTYTRRMVPSSSPGRDIYDYLKSLTPDGKCPLCAHRVATTLDHYLPKAQYPILAVTPINLVPACTDCNKKKLAVFPTSASDETLHPYFDIFDDERWLKATVVETVPASLRYFVEPPADWDAVKVARMNFHFNTLQLADLYANQAADELINIRHQLEIIHNAGGAALVSQELLARAASASAARENGWRVSAFEAFANSNWFCSGGFLPI